MRLARYGDVLGEKTGLGRSWIGVVLLAATTSLPELFTGFGATALAALPDIALGDVLGSCMFNLLILSLMDAVQPEPISARAHQGHALAIGFGLLLIGVAGTGLVADGRLPALGWIGLYTPALIALYFVAMRVIFTHEQHRRARETQEVAEELRYGRPLCDRLWCSTASPALRSSRLHSGCHDSEPKWHARRGSGTRSWAVCSSPSRPRCPRSWSRWRRSVSARSIWGSATCLGSNLFNLLILGLDDIFYRKGPLLADASASHGVSILAIVMMNALFLIGLDLQGDDQALRRSVGHRGDRRCLRGRPLPCRIS